MALFLLAVAVYLLLSFDDLYLGLTESSTKGVLKDFLAKYGRVLKETNKRLGKTLKESAVSIVEDYELTLSPDQFIQEITPMYLVK